MRYSKIVLAGGQGYMGQVLTQHFKDKSEQIIVLSRRPRPYQGNVQTLVWDAQHPGKWVGQIDGADLLVNLCGKNVNCRYTPANKKEIIDSRVLPTTLLGQVITTMPHPPKLWINVTSATIYRHADDRPQDEETGEIGQGFSVDVCQQWEESFFAASTPHTRKVALRMGMVLGKSDGVFPRLKNLVRIGMGGKQGNGRQKIAWIHEMDMARIMEWLMEHPLDGVVNATAPEAISNQAFMQTLRTACGVPFGLPMPQWLLEVGAVVIGTETELILKSRWVKPQRLLLTGYPFLFPTISSAINDIVHA